MKKLYINPSTHFITLQGAALMDSFTTSPAKGDSQGGARAPYRADYIHHL